MATNKIYKIFGTSVVFTSSGGDVTFTLDDTVDLGDGQVSNQWDQGAGALMPWLKIEAYMKWVATPTLGDTVRIYLYGAHYAAAACDLVANAAVTPETKFNNFDPIMAVMCSVAADQVFYNCQDVSNPGRYINTGVWNASATKDLNATANVSKIIITPFCYDIQAAA